MKKGYLECSVCNGTGEDGLYVCQKCEGKGIVDWITDIVFKKNHPMSSLQLVNVRKTIAYLRDVVEKTLKENIFVPAKTLEELIKPYLDRCVTSRVLCDYKISDFAVSPNERHIDIEIKPVRSVEMIQLDFKVDQKK